MADNKEIIQSPCDVNAKWDACLDLTVRRFVYFSLGGACGGLLLFRSLVSRWASVAFGAGLGIRSAYTECSCLFEGSPTKSVAPKMNEDKCSLKVEKSITASWVFESRD
ncbi:hypothetical protein ACFX19_025931 [Malus domestica]